MSTIQTDPPPASPQGVAYVPPKACLTREQILKAPDMAVTKEILIPEWGGSVFIRRMSGTERDEFEQDESNIKEAATKGQHLSGFRGRFLARVICDEKGTLLFGVDDFGPLGEKSVKALDRVFAVASKMNALSKADIEDLTKN